jgi:hypothetical protein
VHRNLAVRATRVSAGAAAISPGPNPANLDAKTRRIYVLGLDTLHRAGIEFMVGGAHALTPYAGVVRDTKDLDVFLRRRDCEAARAALGAAGFRTEVTFPHWLAKAQIGDRYIDLIFGAGNGVAQVDDLWFSHAIPGIVLGVDVLLCPPEEMIWSKAFIMERERYDGADVAHLIRACGDRLDWRRLLIRFGRHWRVFFSHLILFGFIYPGERRAIPDWVMAHLQRRLDRERGRSAKDSRVCDGTLLSRQQYLVDIGSGGYEDGRLVPRGEMTAEDIAIWTAAISATPEAAPELSALGRNGRLASRARRRRR